MPKKVKFLKQGRDGKIYDIGQDRVVKIFEATKPFKEVLQEYVCQQHAARHQLAPRVYSLTKMHGRWAIVMEKMDRTLMDVIRESNGLSVNVQKEMVRLLCEMDRHNIFHGDVSPLNFMFKKNRLYLIDFGMSCLIDENFQKQYGSNSNCKVGILAFIYRLREHIPSFSPAYLQHTLDQL